MGAMISFITGLLGRLGFSWLSGILGGALANFVEPIARAAIAIVRGILEIIVDLSRTFEGRIVLALIAGSAAGWYLYATYQVVERRDFAALHATVAAQRADIVKLSRRPEQCPAVRRR